MFCPQCGKEAREGLRFCYSCGYDLRSSAPGATEDSANSSANASAGSAGSSVASDAASSKGTEKVDLGNVDVKAAKEESPQPTPAGPVKIEIGTVVKERYKVEKLLGQGGMGSVYLSLDQTINRKIALKIINADLWQHRSAYLRFVREANVCLDLTHSNIIRVYNLDEWNGQAFLTMEYLEGVSLRALMHHMGKQGKSIGWARTKTILRQALRAMEYAHGRGVVHRDLKPGNIMLAREPDGSHRVVVMDFGLARRDREDAEAKTRVGASLGTPHYMAPEQAVSASKVDLRADIFSMGAIAYELLTGRVPKGKLEPPSQVSPNLPEGIDDWVFKALEHSQDNRFQTAREMSDALRYLGTKKAVQRAGARAGGGPTLADPPGVDAGSASDPTSAFDPSSALFESGSSMDFGSSADATAFPEEGQSTGGSSLDALDSMVAASTGSAVSRRPSMLPRMLRLSAIIGGVALVAAVGFGMMTMLKPDDTPSAAPAGPTPAPGAASEIFVETAGDVSMQMVYVPGGKFTMGNSADNIHQVARDYGIPMEMLEHETPPHEVTLDGFYIGRTEVTNGQYQAFLDNSRYRGERQADDDYLSHFKGGSTPNDDRHPVVFVSWHNANAFANWLSRESGRKYNLPTEAQWEYACRAGTDTQFSFGDDPSRMDNYAWTSANAQGKTHQVAQKRPNAFGLFDMHGNVWEWCLDGYHPDYYGRSPKKNPLNEKASDYRVARGGAWLADAKFCRSSVRSRQTPNTTSNFLGFRVVCVE